MIGIDFSGMPQCSLQLLILLASAFRIQQNFDLQRLAVGGRTHAKCCCRLQRGCRSPGTLHPPYGLGQRSCSREAMKPPTRCHPASPPQPSAGSCCAVLRPPACELLLKTQVASVCFKCFRGMLQVFCIDVPNVDRDDAYVTMVVHVCCKLGSQCFICFLDICCKCVYLNVAYVSYIRCKCFI
jgi:hypothetical protein